MFAKDGPYSGLSQLPRPGSRSDHGSDLPLEAQSAERELAVGAFTQAPKQPCAEHVLERSTLPGETRLLGFCQRESRREGCHDGISCAQRMGSVA
jgi:hypothetical protein